MIRMSKMYCIGVGVALKAVWAVCSIEGLSVVQRGIAWVHYELHEIPDTSERQNSRTLKVSGVARYHGVDTIVIGGNMGVEIVVALHLVNDVWVPHKVVITYLVQRPVKGDVDTSVPTLNTVDVTPIVCARVK